MNVICRGILTRWPVVKTRIYDDHENGIIFAQNDPELLKFVATRKMTQIVAQLLGLRLYAGSDDTRVDWTDRYAIEVPISTSGMETREPERFALVVPNYDARIETSETIVRVPIDEIDSTDLPAVTQAICDAVQKAREPHEARAKIYEARAKIYRVVEELFAST